MKRVIHIIFLCELKFGHTTEKETCNINITFTKSTAN